MSESASYRLPPASARVWPAVPLVLGCPECEALGESARSIRMRAATFRSFGTSTTREGGRAAQSTEQHYLLRTSIYGENGSKDQH